VFYVNYLISLTHLCFIAFLLLHAYIVFIDVLIYAAAQLQDCWINLLTYLERLTYVKQRTNSFGWNLSQKETYHMKKDKVTVRAFPARLISAKNMRSFRIFNRLCMDKT